MAKPLQRSEVALLILVVSFFAASAVSSRFVVPSETSGVVFALVLIPWGITTVAWNLSNVARGGYERRPFAVAVYGIVASLSAYWLSPLLPIVGLNETLAVAIVLLYLIGVGVAAYILSRRYRFPIAAVSAGLTVATLALELFGLFHPVRLS